MNLFGTIGRRFDPGRLDNRNQLSHFRWLMHKVRSMLSLASHKTTVSVQFESGLEPVSGSNIASVFMFFARLGGFAFLIFLKCSKDSAIGPWTGG